MAQAMGGLMAGAACALANRVAAWAVLSLGVVALCVHSAGDASMTEWHPAQVVQSG